MKKAILTILILMFASVGWCQCVAEIKDVVQDELRGSIIVKIEYVLNGKVVEQGNTRYLETSGTEAEIIALAKEDIEIHCTNLIRRIKNNTIYIVEKMLERQKILTDPIIPNIKPLLVGQKKTVTEATDTFKGKDIKVTYDEKNTITNTP